MYQVEQLLLAKFTGHISIIHAGGLIGGERHPVISLAKKPDAIVEDAPINMIHRDDLIEVIFAISEMTVPPAVINAVTPYHPMKSMYYEAWSKLLNCSAIQFSSQPSNNKIITSEVLPDIYTNWRNPVLDRL